MQRKKEYMRDNDENKDSMEDKEYSLFGTFSFSSYDNPHYI